MRFIIDVIVDIFALVGAAVLALPKLARGLPGFCRRHLWDIVIIAVVAACLTILLGCSSRENAKAAKQADQSIEAAQHFIADFTAEFVKLGQMPPAERLNALLSFVNGRLVQARQSLAAPLDYLARGTPVTDQEAGTSADLALTDPDQFDAKADAQAVAAAVEAKEANFWHGVAAIASKLVGALANNWLGIALGGTGAGTTALAIGWALKRVGSLKKVLSSAVEHGEFADRYISSQAPPELQAGWKDVKQKSAELQDKLGVREQIKSVIATLRPPKNDEPT